MPYLAGLAENQNPTAIARLTSNSIHHMNRIYQGRISKVQTLKPGKKGSNPEDWENLPGCEDALWQHHELFQDAVNFYTLALAAMAAELQPNAQKGMAALAWREQVRENWLDGFRKAVRYDGPHRRLAKWLNVDASISNEHTAFDASAKAILKINVSTSTHAPNNKREQHREPNYFETHLSRPHQQCGNPHRR